MADDIVAKHDDRHVHQIIRDEDGCQCPFGVCTQLFDHLVGIILVFVQVVEVVGRQGEKSDFRA